MIKYYRKGDKKEVVIGTEELIATKVASLETDGWIEVENFNTPEDQKANLIKDYDLQIQAHLDAVAKARGYDNIMSACCYASVANPYQAEGQAAVQWRASVWAHCYLVLQDVENELRTIPTIEEMVAELPAIVWPT